jgi:hypothetical protein
MAFANFLSICIYKNGCMCVCMFQHNSVTPGAISTKLGTHIAICMCKNLMYILYCGSLPREPPAGYPKRYQSNNSINKITTVTNLRGGDVGAFHGNLPQVSQPGSNVKGSHIWCESARCSDGSCRSRQGHQYVGTVSPQLILSCFLDTSLGNLREVPVEGSHNIYMYIPQGGWCGRPGI